MVRRMVSLISFGSVMRKSIPFLVLSVFIFLMDADALDKTKTADGVAYPQPEGRMIPDNDLPFVHRWLDALPGDVGRAKVWSIGCNKGPVPRWVKMLDDNKIDTTDYQYITNGLQGAEAVLLSVQNGRVQSLLFFYPNLSSTQVQRLLSPLAKWADKAKNSAAEFAVLKGDEELCGSLVGSHSFDVEVHQSVSAEQYFQGGGVTHHTENYFSGIAIGVSPVDWEIFHNKVPKAIADAMREGTLANGMTEYEASLAVDIKGKVVSTDGNSRTIEYVRSHEETVVVAPESSATVLPDASSIHDQMQAGILGSKKYTIVKEDVHLRATFVGGKLDSFVDIK